MSFEEVTYCVYTRHTSLRAASHRAIGYLLSETTSDQSDESDLLKFVQNQIREK